MFVAELFRLGRSSLGADSVVGVGVGSLPLGELESLSLGVKGTCLEASANGERSKAPQSSFLAPQILFPLLSESSPSGGGCTK